MFGSPAYSRTYQISSPDHGSVANHRHHIAVPFKHPPVVTVWGHDSFRNLIVMPFPGIGPAIEFDPTERIVVVPVANQSYYPITVNVVGNP
jgi:hypothetical protein